jgi:hypothetical protein
MRSQSIILVTIKRIQMMLPSRHISRFFLVGIILLAGCIQPIDLATDYIGGQIVISGAISNDPDDPQYLDIGITAETTRLPLPVDDAVAYLFDNQGTRVPYTFIGNGRYKLQDNFRGVPGVSYRLEVTLSDGRFYQSEPEKMPWQTASLDAKGQFKIVQLTDIEGAVTSRPLIDITADIQLPEDENLYLRWSMSEVYIRNPTDFPDIFNSIPPPCYISGEVDPQRIALFNGAENSTKKLVDFQLGQRLVDNTFLEKHYIIVQQHSITFEAYDYWRKTDLVANRTGSIFDTPPAELLGNLKCITNPGQKVYGYFEARNTATDRFYTLPSDISVYIEPFCYYVPDKPLYLYAPECLDCLSLPNSSWQRPDWF